MLKRWQDDPFLEKIKDNLPTIGGYRRDIGYHAKSMMEANLARAILYSGRAFESDYPIELKVEGKHKHVFGSDQTTMFIDFATTTKRGTRVLYEIMVHPFEDPKGKAKLEMLLDQYPDINIRIINNQSYTKLRAHFESRINADPRFIAWETGELNLKTHPTYFW